MRGEGEDFTYGKALPAPAYVQGLILNEAIVNIVVTVAVRRISWLGSV
jgi:hypothetical protein